MRVKNVSISLRVCFQRWGLKRRYHLATEEGDEAAAAVGDPASLRTCLTEGGEAAAGGEACLKISRKEMDFFRIPIRN